jgi:uncharacterized membrane protein YadS
MNCGPPVAPWLATLGKVVINLVPFAPGIVLALGAAITIVCLPGVPPTTDKGEATVRATFVAIVVGIVLTVAVDCCTKKNQYNKCTINAKNKLLSLA